MYYRIWRCLPMCTIKINSRCKQYKKEDKTTLKSIYSSLQRLSEKISSENSDINRIYNNDNIIYDRINDQIFIYKTHGINNIQLRLVYGYEENDNDAIIYLIDYAVKKKNDKRYIEDMNNRFKSMKLSDMLFCDMPR